MTADNKEEEYQFPDQEEYQASSEEERSPDLSSEIDDEVVSSKASSEGLLHRVSEHPFVQNKRMIAVLLLALVVVVVVSVMKRDRSTQQQVESQVVQATKTVSAPSRDAFSEVDAKVFASKINTNYSSTVKLSKQITQLNAQLKNLQDQQSKIVSILPTLKENLTLLTAKVQDLSAVHAKKTSDKNKNQLTYFIRAMVPGRAWLVSSFGKTASVGRGEELEGYGKILSVDQNDGIVYTSSGREIVYGKRDV